jgi:hypothetical protein
MDEASLIALEAAGPEAVLRAMALGGHGAEGSRTRADVEAWLRSKQVAADEAASSKRDAREERTLAIASEALSIAKEHLASARASASAASEQARWARWAAIIAMVAAVIAAKDQILAFIFSSQ